MKKGLLISQAPMRLSFLGGGTDFESYFKGAGKMINHKL
jgi:galactokinase/mevalonate kinase-like predicted kinase